MLRYSFLAERPREDDVRLEAERLDGFSAVSLSEDVSFEERDVDLPSDDLLDLLDLRVAERSPSVRPSCDCVRVERRDVPRDDVVPLAGGAPVSAALRPADERRRDEDDGRSRVLVPLLGEAISSRRDGPPIPYSSGSSVWSTWLRRVARTGSSV